MVLRTVSTYALERGAVLGSYCGIVNQTIAAAHGCACDPPCVWCGSTAMNAIF